MTDHLPNARQLARREPADGFRELERHLDAGAQGEVAGSLKKHTRLTDVYGAAAVLRLVALDSIHRGGFHEVPGRPGLGREFHAGF